MSIQLLNAKLPQAFSHLSTTAEKNQASALNADAKRLAESSEKSPSGFSAHEARKLLNDKILAALDKTLAQPNQATLHELNAGDFSPEKVVNSILSFVSAAFFRLSSTDKSEKNQTLSQARTGVESGFSDAKNILEGLGIFNGDIAKSINNIYDLLQKGLGKIASNIDAGLPITSGLFNNDKDLQSEQQSLLNRRFSLEMQTRDGDKITINVERLQASSENNDGVFRFSRSAYNMSVSGNLDENELKAVEELLGKMFKTANTFFESNTQAALDQVVSLGYNSTEIVDFTLKLKEVQQTKVTSTYQQVAQQSDESLFSQNLDQLVKPIQAYVTQFLDTNRQFMGEKLIDNNQEQFARLFEQIAKINARFRDETDLEKLNALNTELLTRSVS